MIKPVMSDAEIKRRKKIQGHITQTTSTLGLGSLGVLAASRGTKNPTAYKAFKKVPGLRKTTSPKQMQDKMKDAALTGSLVSGGIGGVGGYNFAAYTGAESRKRKAATVKKSDDMSPTFSDEGISKRFEVVSKIGEWKTIDQRELSQRRSRKAMRYAGAGAAAGAALIAGGHGAGATKKTVGLARGAKATMKNPMFNSKSKRKVIYEGVKDSAKADGGVAAQLGGGALIGASGVVGSGAKGHHTYQQHKVNERRRANFKRDVEKAWTPSSSKFDPEGKREKRADAYPKVLAVGSGAAAGAAGYKGLQAIKAGAKAKQYKKTMKNPKHAAQSSTHRGFKAAQKSSAVKGGKLAAVAVGLGGGAVAAEKWKKSKSWSPYVSKSAFGVDHD